LRPDALQALQPLLSAVQLILLAVDLGLDILLISLQFVTFLAVTSEGEVNMIRGV
jgi:hypothetical protein